MLHYLSRLKATAVVLSISVICSASMAGVYDTWNCRMKIRMAGYDKPETLTNFPTLLVLSTNTAGFLYSDFSSVSNGADLRFADSNQTTALNYEIEKWDTNGSSYVWVQIPAITSTNDYIYAYWGKSTSVAPCTTNGATWTNGYQAVWHFDEASGSALDSTSNRYDGTVNNATRGASGKILSGYSFDGASDWVSANMTPASSVTISMWANNTAGANGGDMLWCVRGANPGPDLFFSGGSIYLNTWDSGNNPFCVQPSDISIFHHYVTVIDSVRTELYIDGRLAGTAAYRNPSFSPFNISSSADGGQYDWQGVIDEASVSGVRRSSNWIYACWLDQASNSTFAVLSDAGPVASSLTVRSDAASGIGPTYATMNGTVVHTGDAENPDVYFCWGYTDGLTNSTSAWANVTFVGASWGRGESFSTNITGLLSGSSYVYRCYVTNSTGTNWSSDATAFTTIYKPSVANPGAALVARLSAMLRGQVSDAGGQAPSTWFYYWADGSGTSNSAAVGAQSGSFSNSIGGLTAGTLYHYSILASNSAGTTWSATSDFQTRSSTAYEWYVAGNGDNTYGTNWTTAISSIQIALSNAGSNDTIYVRGETFTLNQQLGWSNSYVSVLGGYEGSGTPGIRDPATWPTILTRAASTIHRIFYISGVTNGSLTGVTVTNGYALATGYPAHPAGSGAGLYITGCPGFVMDDCRVLYNTGFDPVVNGGDIYGGGIFMEASSVTLTNCVISSNRVDATGMYNIRSGDGGGLALYSGTCQINNCRIIGNYAHGDGANGGNKGGGLYLNGTATVRRSVVQLNNSTDPGNYGDGVYIGSSGNVFFENCLVTDNHGSDAGSAFWQDGGTLRIENCTIASNKTYGIRCNAGTAAVTNCILWGNGDDVYEATVGAVKLGYSIIEDGDSMNVNGCINSDPRFIDQVYFHEESPYGQYQDGYFSGGSWGSGTQISPAVDRGSTNSVHGLEPDPNGARINMGAYGNTAAASKSHPIAVTNRGATAIGSTSATLNGTLLDVGSSNVTVWFYYGLADGFNDPGAWDIPVLVGVMNSSGTVSKVVSGLANGNPYFYTLFASNSAGATAWASPSTNFTPSLSPAVLANRGVLNSAGPTATLQGEVITTGGEDPQVYVCWGSTVGGTTIASWEHSTYLGFKPSGTFSTDVSVDPGSNYFYTCYATNSGGTTWAAPSLPFGTHRIRYVDSGAAGTGTGYSWGDAFTTVQAALDDCISSETNLVYIKGGTYGLLSTLNGVASHVTLQGGCEGIGTPGNISAATWPTVITNASGGVTRLLTISGVTDGTIRDITFTGGNMGGSGGAISMVDSTNMVVDNCIFRGNRTAANGGAVYASGIENLTFRNSTLSGNVALNNNAIVNGGAIYATGCFGGTITNCMIERNIVSSTYAGGQIHCGGGAYILGGGWTIRDSRISYNIATGPETYGGGMLFTGSATHSVKNCVIAQNEAGGGDGIAVTGWNGPTIAINNCTLVGNVGQGVYTKQTGAITVRNSILWENGDEVAIGGGTITLVNCDNQDGDAGTGCISVSPQFERGVYLATNSPCVDAGSDTAANLGLAGYTTRADGVLDTAGNVDLGYHAFTGISTATADLYVKNTGDNSNSGTNWAQAFRTITKALSVATDGSRIHVEAGTYNTNNLETFPLSLTKMGLQLIGTNSATTIIDAYGSNQRVVDMTDNSGGRIEGVAVCRGGGVFLYYASGSGINIVNAFDAMVLDCIISNNEAGRPGAGIYVGNSRSINIANSLITTNTLDVADRDQERAGGGFYADNSYGVISNCVFSYNAAKTSYTFSYTGSSGGAMGLGGGAWNILETVMVRNTAHSDTQNGRTARGAGLIVYSGTHVFRNCLVATNRVLVADQYAFGHGINIDGGANQFMNLTVAGNGREGFRIAGGTATITNSILYGHTVDLTNAAGTVTMDYSDVGVTSSSMGSHCLSVDPLFVDMTYCHLQSKRGNYINGYFTGGSWASSLVYSPLLDMGDPASDYGAEPRPHGNRINVGAYGNTSVASLSSAAQGTVFVVH